MATSMLNYGDPEDVVSCPYNKSHQIIRKRMQFHLVKCKKNYPDANLQECIYNAIHKIPEPEMKFHLETCPDRHKLDKFYYSTANSENSLNRFPIANIDVEADECWDNINVPTYDPVKKCETAPILRQLNVESAAKKRDFRYAERQRLQALAQVKTEHDRVEVERERAIAFAQRASSSSTIVPGPNIKFEDVEETDPFEVTSLMDRIRSGAVPFRPISDRFKSQTDETDTDAAASDSEKWETPYPRAKRGCGRGKFVKNSNGHY